MKDRKTEFSKRLIGKLDHGVDGPNVIFTGGIHGNEPSGVRALEFVIALINERKIKVRGVVTALAGNLAALKANRRYLDKDLNRMWVEENLRLADSDLSQINGHPAELVEMVELRATINRTIEESRGRTLLIDLHTTSSRSVPFMASQSHLTNAGNYPLPNIVNIDAFLPSTMHAYYYKQGHDTMVFEAGSLNDESSAEHHIAFVMLALVNSGSIQREDLIDYQTYYDQLSSIANGLGGKFQITYRHGIDEEDNFKMNPGYSNFQRISKGEELAINSAGKIISPVDGHIFMPLYQKQGEDGFFIVESTK